MLYRVNGVLKCTSSTCVREVAQSRHCVVNPLNFFNARWYHQHSTHLLDGTFAELELSECFRVNFWTTFREIGQTGLDLVTDSRLWGVLHLSEVFISLPGISKLYQM